jgi:hypothetical protein
MKTNDDKLQTELFETIRRVSSKETSPLSRTNQNIV